MQENEPVGETHSHVDTFWPKTFDEISDLMDWQVATQCNMKPTGNSLYGTTGALFDVLHKCKIIFHVTSECYRKWHCKSHE